MRCYSFLATSQSRWSQVVVHKSPCASRLNWICFLGAEYGSEKHVQTSLRPRGLLFKANGGKQKLNTLLKDEIFVQGNRADCMFYINEGKVELTVVSKQGKEAVVAILRMVIWRGVPAGQPLRMSAAVAMSACSVVKLEKMVVVALLHKERRSQSCRGLPLSRNVKIEEDLVDQLFNSARRGWREYYCWRTLSKVGVPQSVIPQMSQETLAGIVGTTRSRVNWFS